MNTTIEIRVLAAAAMVAVAALLPSTAFGATAPTGSKPALPKLVDLGADKCIPCKLMAPILKDLKKEYAGRMDVEFIDVWKNPAAATNCNIKLIPTQIFYGSSGQEIFRHEGFFGKADILAKWKALGIDLAPGKPNGKAK
jgi:thioredoxin 1